MDEEIRAHYEQGAERDRLGQGYSRIEFARTKELLRRVLPEPPSAVLDVGGGPGLYADWLADEGYGVRLADAVPLHVEQAAELAAGRFEATVGDARQLDEEDGVYEVVLLFGPLYHLVERDDRLAALREAKRVLRPGGLLAAAGISRFASLLDGLVSGSLRDLEFRRIVENDLREGQHRNPGRLEYFTTAFFHRPEELVEEVAEAGFEVEGFFGVEGPGWLRPELWDEPGGQDAILYAARAIEQETALVAMSAHLLAIGRR
jgi:SAM-dependent methyltransferase